MKLEKLVTSLEMSQKLKDAGFEVDTPFMYVGGELWDETMQSDYETPATVNREEWIPAYTFAQLWEVLPEVSVLSAHTESIKIPSDGDGWICTYGTTNPYLLEEFEMAHKNGIHSLPDTAAEAVLFCMENGYIKTDE